MNYFTSNINEMKREIVKFSRIMSNEFKKTDKKFICDRIYGLGA